MRRPEGRPFDSRTPTSVSPCHAPARDCRFAPARMTESPCIRTPRTSSMISPVRRRTDPICPVSPLKWANPIRRHPSNPGFVVEPLAKYASQSPARRGDWDARASAHAAAVDITKARLGTARRDFLTRRCYASIGRPASRAMRLGELGELYDGSRPLSRVLILTIQLVEIDAHSGGLAADGEAIHVPRRSPTARNVFARWAKLRVVFRALELAPATIPLEGGVLMRARQIEGVDRVCPA